MSQKTGENAANAAAEAAEKPRADAGRFQKGNPGYGLRRTAAKKDQASLVPALLRAMRTVTTRPESKDRSQLEKECREWLRSDRKGFLTKLADLEKAALAARSKTAPEPQPLKKEVMLDKGGQRVEELIMRLLEQAGESAKVGSRVSDAWACLSSSDKQAILDILDSAPSGARPDSRGTHPDRNAGNGRRLSGTRGQNRGPWDGG
jgi:hypothetical protein